MHGFPRLKIHAKTTLVVRRDPDGLRRYAHIGTGNYHAVTARLYEDLGLFTADEEITADVADLFNYLTGFGKPRELPQAARRAVQPARRSRRGDPRDRRRREGRHAGARFGIKVNALHDEQMIEELYRASEAGVQIDVVARRICGLRPGVKGMSENVRVRSVLGRFLEHSRFFVFKRGDESRYLLGSADLLPRNLDHRIEVVAPDRGSVAAGGARRELRRPSRSTTRRRGSCSRTASWPRVRPAKGEPPQSAHSQLMKRARSRARRVAGPADVEG